MSKMGNQYKSRLNDIKQEYSKEQIINIFANGKNKNQIAKEFGYEDNDYHIVEKLADYYGINIKDFWWFNHPRTPNRIGTQVNNFIIIDYDQITSAKRRKTHWKVKCTCGNPNILSVSDDNLIHNKSTSCGRCNTYKEIGKKYGFLEILEVTKWVSCSSGKSYPVVKTLCHNCNKISERPLASVRSSSTISCGCFKSSIGEWKITQILDELGYKYIKQKKYPDLKDKQLLSYDFYLPDFNLLIEYQGEQHFNVIEEWGGEEGFKLRKKHDNMKLKYAYDNNIRLALIHYKDLNKINKDYILFLVEGGKN